MLDFLELLFSPSGCVGRAVWWIGAILAFLAEVVLVVIAVLVIGHAIIAADPTATPFSQKLTPAEITRHWAAIQSVRGEIYALGGAFLLIIWINFVIEIKRWHDRGMSGFWVLLRFVPTCLQVFQARQAMTPEGMLTIWAIVIVVWLFQFIQLGLLPGVETAPPQGSRRYTTGSGIRPGGYPARSYVPPPQAPLSSSGFGTFMLGFICALFLIAAVGAAYFLGYVNVPNAASLNSQIAHLTNSPAAAAPTPAPAPAPAPVIPPPQPSSGINDNLLNSEHVESDSLTKTYAKDWVIADGERMNGITRVMPVPGMQVAIAYSNGAKNLPAASLPSGFLAQWNITDAALQLANQPKTNAP